MHELRIQSAAKATGNTPDINNVPRVINSRATVFLHGRLVAQEASSDFIQAHLGMFTKTTPQEDTGSDGETDFLSGGVNSDQDGFLASQDCDDNKADVNPDGTEIPNDGIDQDCDKQGLQSPVISTDPMMTEFLEK